MFRGRGLGSDAAHGRGASRGGGVRAGEGSLEDWGDDVSAGEGAQPKQVSRAVGSETEDTTRGRSTSYMCAASESCTAPWRRLCEAAVAKQQQTAGVVQGGAGPGWRAGRQPGKKAIAGSEQLEARR